MRVPKHLDELTVKQFIECNDINNNTSLSLLDKNILLVSALTDKSVSELESMPTLRLKVYVAQTGRLFHTELSQKTKRFILVKGRAYQAIQLASELRDLMSTDQFTTYSEYTKNDPIKNLHLILPLMYCPYRLFKSPAISKNQSKLQEIFLHAKMGDVSGTAFFFEKQLQQFIPVLEKMGARAMEEINEHMEKVLACGTGSIINTAGTTR